MKDRLNDHLEGWQFCENCGIKLYQQKNPTISNVKSLDLWSSRTGQIRTCRGKAPPSCLRKTVLLLKSPTGAFVASQTQTFFLRNQRSKCPQNGRFGCHLCIMVPVPPVHFPFRAFPNLPFDGFFTLVVR